MGGMQALVGGGANSLGIKTGIKEAGKAADILWNQVFANLSGFSAGTVSYIGTDWTLRNSGMEDYFRMKRMGKNCEISQ